MGVVRFIINHWTINKVSFRLHVLLNALLLTSHIRHVKRQKYLLSHCFLCLCFVIKSPLYSTAVRMNAFNGCLVWIDGRGLISCCSGLTLLRQHLSYRRSHFRISYRVDNIQKRNEVIDGAVHINYRIVSTVRCSRLYVIPSTLSLCFFRIKM